MTVTQPHLLTAGQLRTALIIASREGDRHTANLVRRERRRRGLTNQIRKEQR